jgi:hypothetical protein
MAAMNMPIFPPPAFDSCTSSLLTCGAAGEVAAVHCQVSGVKYVSLCCNRRDEKAADEE